MFKKILGLDLGTNSIGWALVKQDIKERKGEIIGAGSRIIPMSQDVLGKFDSGQSLSQTAERTGFRGIRRLRERQLLRRERLHRVLNILGFLPKHYAKQIDFEKHFGKFIPETEPKLPWIFNQETKKIEFLFQKSFDEMLQDFARHQPQLIDEGRKVPYDWTIYYLRKKALTAKIEREELAWLLLNFNQKRGYYQLRGEDDEDQTTTAETRIYFVTEIIDSITDTGQVYKGLKVFNIKLSNGESGKYYNKVEPEWLNIEKNIIVTVSTDKNGNDRLEEDGSVKKKFTIPTDDDWDKKWKLVKIKTEKEINDSHKTVGAYIYDTLLRKPDQKIKGKLVRVIERKFYKNELEAILKKQQLYHDELRDVSIYQACADELYKNNDAHRTSIEKKDFTHLFLNDIIFYQRPLKSKKSLISNCSFEKRPIKDKDGKLVKDENGKQVLKPIKCIAKSHPLFQEFRLWQFIQNLKIYQKEKEIDGKLQPDVNVTSEILKSEEDWINLFEWLNARKEVDHKALFNYLLKPLKLKPANYRWNYVYDAVKDESKAYPCNETRALILSRLNKLNNVPANFLNKENEEALWHILYSVEDKNDIQKALKTFGEKHGLEEDFIEQFKKFPPFKKEYGSYSAKAIKKLLPLMRIGKYWSEDNIHPHTKERIDKIISGEYDETIRDRVRDKSLDLACINHFCGLQVWLVSYIVYDRHSEDGEALKWNSPADMEEYLKNEFKQHSLRNPIVEQVIIETLRVVKDIWQVYGKGEENFFDEIHIELGREMKNPADKRKDMTNQINENENTNLRIKALLVELMNDLEYESVRAYSPMQQEILKIYEEGVLNAASEIPEDVLKISKQAQPTQTDLNKYKLWLQQGYRSPYTGVVIPLNKLFTRAYDIEHVIPQSRFFDDSFSNKIICEVEVNSDKDNKLAFEYIKNNGGKKIELSNGNEVTLFTVEAYEEFVKRNYVKARGKMKKLLMEEIPEAFIQRQMNDSRYISKVVKNLMSNIVRETGEQEAISKNIIATNGSITNTLKQDWGLNDVWNEIITPRFERLNELTSSKNFGDWTNKDGKRIFQTSVPLELQKGFSKKRIDHRHHALDAIIIACATRNHINYLNNDNANGKDKNKPTRYDLRNKLRRLEKIQVERLENGQKIKRTIEVGREFLKPWETFTQDAKGRLHGIVVSFKQNLRIINKTVNNYQVLKKDEDGNVEKQIVKQTKGDNWAIRKPMHKDTVSGLVQLRFKKIVSLSSALDNWEMIVDKSLRKEVKRLVADNYDKKNIAKYFKENENKWNNNDISRVEIYSWYIDKKGEPTNVASRVKIDESFSSGKIISITDTGIQKIMMNHLKKYHESKSGMVIEHPELAFSPDGVDEMNKNIRQLNNNISHHPIYKVRTFEPKGNKFNVGQTGNKKDKYVEAAKGINLFFAIYVDENGKRSYDTIPLNIVIERQKQGLLSVPEINEAGHKLLYQLSPNDLVYVSTLNEQEHPTFPDFGKLSISQIKRIYKIVSFTGNRLSAVPYYVAKSIVDKVEFTQLNKLEFSIEDKSSIKEVCIKLKVDRLGNISLPTKINKPPYPRTNNEFKEPETIYTSKFVSGSASFDDMEQEQLKYFASLTPNELLQNHKKQSLAAFGLKDEMDKQKPDRTIKFDTEE